MEELKTKIKELGPWWHDIDLGNGIRTRPQYDPKHDPSGKWKKFIGKCFPNDMTGSSVLDVGCNTGFNSVQCKLRGATRIVAIDEVEKSIRQAEFITKYFDVPVELKKIDAHEYVLTTDEQFDYVIFSRVFYHLKYPKLVLDRLAQMTRKRLVILTEIFGDSEMLTPKDDYHQDDDEILKPNFPKMLYIEKKYGNDNTNWWIPNDSCCVGLLHSAGLRILEHPRPGIFFCEPNSKNQRREISTSKLYLP